MKFVEDFLYESKQEVSNGAPWSLSKCWECAIQQYGLPFLHCCISVLYAIYTSCTAVNVVLFLVKIVPTGMYVSNLVRNIYVTSRDRMKLNQIELEDIQLQIQILNTKLSARDAEFIEREEELRKGIEKYRKVRARVQEVIAADEELRHTQHESVPWEEDSGIQNNSSPEEHEFILQLLKDIKYGQEPRETSCDSARAASLQEESVYSSASETDLQQDYRVKIVKVTNVCKVGYLKQFIKQRKLRRTTKYAILKKKVETVKQLFEDWQKILDMVINSKIAILNMDPRYVEVASQEAMGDYTKQDLREFSDPDSESRNFNDNYFESYLSVTKNTHINDGNFTNSFEDISDTAVSRDNSELQYGTYPCDLARCHPHTASTLLAVLPEETVSQMAIAEVRSEASDE